MDQNICIFGASTTWGAWDHEKAGWANRLRLSMGSNEDIFIYNLGISGNTTNDLLKRFDAEAKARDATAFIFSIGDNDSVFVQSKNNQWVPIEEFEKNLEKLIGKAKKISPKIVFLGCKPVDESKTTPVSWAPDYSYKNKNLMEYDQKISEVCKRMGVYYLKIFDVLKLEDLADGVHLNEKGHEKIFLKLKNFLIEKKILE